MFQKPAWVYLPNVTSNTKKTMKHFIFILTLILCINPKSKGQPYASIFGDTATSWTLGWEVFDNYMIVALKVNGDTIIQNTEYKKIVYQDVNQLFGFLREDTIIGKAWFLYRNDTSEKLIMDLSLSIGDSFNINLDNWRPDFYSIVDSVYFLNNKKHIRFNSKIDIVNRQENYTFIEGVSSNAGFTFQTEFISPNPNSHFLFCAFKDNISIFKNNLFNGDCFPVLGGFENLNKSKIAWALSPNPFTNSAELKFDNYKHKDCSLIILDQYGRQVDCYENIIYGNVIISKKHLTTGLYYFKLISDNILKASGKFIIN